MKSFLSKMFLILAPWRFTIDSFSKITPSESRRPSSRGGERKWPTFCYGKEHHFYLTSMSTQLS
jgi:hypothetical protein